MKTDRDNGFSLIEITIALVTLAISLAYALPLFLYAKVNNSKSEIRTGALIVAQRTFDDIRAKPFNNIPLTDGKNSPSSSNPVALPATNPPTPSELSLTKALGRQYRVTVTYCGDLNDDPSICSDKYRKFKVEVNYNGTKVYDLEGTYTQFE